MTHGTVTEYSKGCRCVPCVDAKGAAKAYRMARSDEAAERTRERRVASIDSALASEPSAADALGRLRMAIPDGWAVVYLTRSGMTWTAAAAPVSFPAQIHFRKVTGSSIRTHHGGARFSLFGQGDTPGEALDDLREHVVANLDPRLMVRRADVATH